MIHTVAIKENFVFRRLYRQGKHAVSPLLAVYCKKNRLGCNRLGVTVSTKVGNAVTRNLVRRRIKEAYRIHESEFRLSYDVVVVSRVRCAEASFQEIERALLELFSKLRLMENGEE